MGKIYKLLPLVLTSFLLVGCGGGNTSSESHSSTSSSGSTSQSSTSSTETTSQSSTSSTTSSQPVVNNYTVNCFNWSFSSGTQFGGSDQSSNRTALINFLNNGSGLISDITDSEKIQSGAFGDHSSSVAFQIGSGSYNGKFTFAFAKSLTKISVTAESYWKSFDYPSPGTISADTECELKFAQSGSLIHTLDLKTSDHGKEDTAIIEFAEPTNTLSLFTDTFDEEGVGVPGRVMIKSITFYYCD